MSQIRWSVEGRRDNLIECRACKWALPLESIGEYFEISTVSLLAGRPARPASLEEINARIRSAKVTKNEGGRTAISINDEGSVGFEGVKCWGREGHWILRLQSRFTKAGELESGRYFDRRGDVERRRGSVATDLNYLVPSKEVDTTNAQRTCPK